MRVEVVKWENEDNFGLLKNDPFIVKHLKAGSQVNKSESEIFDYMIYLPDGTKIRNKTGEIISKMNY